MKPWLRDELAWAAVAILTIIGIYVVGAVVSILLGWSEADMDGALARGGVMLAGWMVADRAMGRA